MGHRKIVLFGGDDCTRCLDETWLYDCGARTWSRAEPKRSPPPRAACAMVYVPDQEVVLLAGGYGPGWVKLTDTWVYRTADNTWTRLALDLPAEGRYCSADYDPASKAVLLCISDPSWGRNTKTVLYGLRLDASSVPKARAAPGPQSPFHCKQSRKWGAPLPAEWLTEQDWSGDADAGRKELAGLPANTWVLRTPPMKARARQWGSYIYDARTHTAYAWGGGHFGYIGAEVSEYNVLTNRWRSMSDPVNYKLPWRHPAGGGSPGVSFQGWRLMGTHARKSYQIDPLSGSLITLHGDVYDLAEHRFVANIGRCPGPYGLADQVSFVTAPHGLYAFYGKHGGGVYRANVAAGVWDLIAKSGPPKHHEHDPRCYDSARDRLLTFGFRTGEVWAFDLKAKTWTQEKAAGKTPGMAAGDPAYIPELDAALFVFASQPKGPPGLFLYKLDERKWYTAPYRGAKAGTHGHLNNSSAYDAKLKLVIRLSHAVREGFVDVAVMRLKAKSLALSPIQ